MTRDVKVWSSSRKEIINGVRGPAQKNKRRFVVQIQLEIQAHLINTPLWLCRALALRQCEVISRSPAKLNRCCLICHLISLVLWLFFLFILVHVGTLILRTNLLICPKSCFKSISFPMSHIQAVKYMPYLYYVKCVLWKLCLVGQL